MAAYKKPSLPRARHTDVVIAVLMLAFQVFVPALQEGDTLPTMMLRDQANQPVHMGVGGRQVMVVSFFYTRCADREICSTVTEKFKWMQDHLRHKEPISLVEISLDPIYDDQRSLAKYGQVFQAKADIWHLSRGRPTQIAALASRFDLRIIKKNTSILNHTENVIIVEPNGKIYQMYQGVNFNPADILATAREATGVALPWYQVLRLWLGQDAAILCGQRSAFSSSITVGMLLTFLFIACVALTCACFHAFRYYVV